MRKKYAEDLAKEFDFETKEQYFEYIVENLINGNRSHVEVLFNRMKGYDQREFLNDYLQSDGGYQESTRKICIAQLCG